MNSGLFLRLADALINHPDEFLPWYNPKSISECERVFDASSGKHKIGARLHLLSALVHSDEPDNIRCAITILEAGLLLFPISAMRKTELMYLQSVGYYRIGNYSKSLDLVNGCLEIAPQCWKAFALTLVIENRFKEEGVKDMLISAAKMVGVAAGLPGFTTNTLYPTRAVEAVTLKIAVEDHFKQDMGAALFHYRLKISIEEEMCIHAIRYSNMGNHSRSRLILDCCLEIAPECERAIDLKKSLDSKWTPRASFKELTKGDAFVIGFCIAFYAGWFVSSLARKK